MQVTEESNLVRPLCRAIKNSGRRSGNVHRPKRIKSGGYLVSTLSVVLLGAPSWKNASTNPMLMCCLLAGVAASIAGMGLRWWSYRIEQDEK
jgi:hypothetical protein